MKHTLLFCFTLFLIPLTLVACQTSNVKYPYDYEQLSEDERIVIRFSHVVGEDTPKGRAARKFAELVKERSEGFIEVQVFSNGSLYKDSEEMKALQNGDIQMIAPAISKLTFLIPEFAIYDLPYAFRSSDEVHEFADSPAGQKLTSRLQPFNLISLGIWDSGFKQLSNNVRPILHYRNLQELRIRIMPSDILSEQYASVGATPKRIEFNNVFSELEQNNVDGQENTLSNITSKNFHSLQDYLTVSNHGYLGYFVLFNLEFWNSLPADMQLLLFETLQEVQQWEWTIAEQMNANILQQIENCQCIDIHYLSATDIEEWQQAFEPIYNYFRNTYGSYYVNALPRFSD
ncbi:MAG: DctP family TRAP transporter solute-binding subunit [Solibacillus sp.]